MVNAQIPEGFELLSGRSKENALNALALAEERGVDPTEVRVSALLGGYLIPIGDSTVDDGDDAPSDKWTVAQLEEYAAAHEIDLPDGKKGDKLKAILDAQASESAETSGEPAGDEASTKEE